MGGPALGLRGGMGLKAGTVEGGVLHPPPALTFTVSGPWLASLILGVGRWVLLPRGLWSVWGPVFHIKWEYLLAEESVGLLELGTLPLTSGPSQAPVPPLPSVPPHCPSQLPQLLVLTTPSPRQASAPGCPPSDPSTKLKQKCLPTSLHYRESGVNSVISGPSPELRFSSSKQSKKERCQSEVPDSGS